VPELLVSWVVLGTVAGFGVHLFSAKRLPGGALGAIAVGILGALLGGYLVTSATHADVMSTSLTWGILLTSAVSAIVVTIVFQSQASVPAKK